MDQHSPSSSSRDLILANPTLPQEVIAAILVRIPVKYLLRFKCVSKDWLALISSPYFVKAHLHFSAKDYTRHRLLLSIPYKPSLLRYCDVSSLFYKSFTESFGLELPVQILGRRYPDVVGSVNGLICLRISIGALVLWNPCMRKFKELPVIMPEPTHKSLLDIYGFGYDDVHEDYKVVVIFYTGFCKYGIYIFSLKSDSWRRIDDFPGGLLSGKSATLVRRKLYWVTKVKGIMSYDLVDEKWAKVEPPCFGVGGIFMTLGLLGSELCVLHNYEGSHCEVWVMKENRVKESWTKLYTIKYDDSMKYKLSQPLCMSNGGELMLRCGSALAIYNPKDDSMRYPQISSNFAATLYMKSLVCPILQNEPRGHNKVVAESGI